jgi:hypothetical protein
LYSGHEKLVFIDRFNFKPWFPFPTFSAEPEVPINIPCKTTHPNVTISLFHLHQTTEIISDDEFFYNVDKVIGLKGIEEDAFSDDNVSMARSISYLFKIRYGIR